MNEDGTYSYTAGNNGKKPVDFKNFGKNTHSSDML